MKKRKVLIPLLSVVTVGATFVPLATLASCGNEEPQPEPEPEPEQGIVVPEEKMEISSSGEFKGFTNDIDVSIYDFVKLPESVTTIGNNAFKALQKENCTISKIVFPSLLTRIGTNAFTGCKTITELDFSALSISGLNKLSMNKAFADMVSASEKAEQGYIIFPEEATNTTLDKDVFKTKLCQEGKLPGEWFRPEDRMQSASWKSGQANWEPILRGTTVQPKNAGAVAADYVKFVQDNQMVFMDDYLYFASKYFGTLSLDEVHVKISNIQFSMTKDEQLPYAAWQIPVASFNIEFSFRDAEGTVHTIEVHFSQMPILIQLKTIGGYERPCITFDFRRLQLEDYEWPTASTNFKVIIDGDQGYRAVNSAYRLRTLANQIAMWLGQDVSDIIMNFVYYDFNIPTQFLKNQIILNATTTDDVICKDGIITGLTDISYSPSMYDTLDLSIFNAKAIGDYAFYDCFGHDTASRINKVVFPQNLQEIGTAAFASSYDEGSTISMLDFTKMDDEAINKLVFDTDAFNFINYYDYVSINANSEEAINTLAIKLYQGGLYYEYLNKDQWFDHVTDWEVWKGGGWTSHLPTYGTAQYKPSIATQIYGEAVNLTPQIFIDDVLNAYANFVNTQERGDTSLKISISKDTIHFTTNEKNETFISFDIKMESSIDGITEVSYKNVPVWMISPTKWVSSYKSALIFDMQLLESDQYDWASNETEITVKQTLNDVSADIKSAADLKSFKQNYLSLYQNIFTNVEVASHYFRSVTLDSSIPTEWLDWELDASGCTIIKGVKNQYINQAKKCETIYIPQIEGIFTHVAANAFSNVLSSNTYINSIKFNWYTANIGSKAFKPLDGSISQIKNIDFSEFDGPSGSYIKSIQIGEDAFDGLDSNGEGKLILPVSPEYQQDIDRLEKDLLQKGKLNASWLAEGFNANKSWDVITYESGASVKHPWEPAYKPLDKIESATLPILYETYIENVKARPSIFTDDLLYSYSQKNPLDPYKTYTIHVSDIVVNDDYTINFTLGYTTELNGESNSYEAEYQGVRFVLIQTADSWQLWLAPNANQPDAYNINIYDTSSSQRTLKGNICKDNYAMWEATEDLLLKQLFLNFWDQAYVESHYLINQELQINK